MQSPLQITFRNLPKSEVWEARIRERAERLERHHDRITAARVVVEMPHKSPGSPKNPIALSVEVDVPGKVLMSHAEDQPRAVKGDALRVIGDVFDAMERQLDDYVRIRRRDTKTPGAGAGQIGRVGRLYPEQSYGFIERVDGVDLYFHRDVVENGGFDALSEGATVEYAVAAGEGSMGPQASSVRRLGDGHPIR